MVIPLIIFIVVLVIILSPIKMPKNRTNQTQVQNNFSDEDEYVDDYDEQDDFSDDCYDIANYGTVATKEMIAELTAEWKLKERWEDYPLPDYNATHTYCQVAFDNSGKSFYYRTRNPDLRVGDIVYVPVGRKYEKRVGKIISMKDYKGYKAPFPLEKTKYIISKFN